MPRTRSAQHDFDRLADVLNAMNQRVSGALRDCCTALRRSDAILAAKIMAADEDIDALQQRVDSIASRIIAHRQPLARDLRWVLATMSVAAELERMGDYANMRRSTSDQCPLSAVIKNEGRPNSIAQTPTR